ncbi:hypothetical protein WJX72_003231 [[Myrmecia] bisecta]|uniref:Uncharacterized protein n=1 Tax=[Myrmecia] bisecta TaxID=41462 RepID=A0AAW1QPX4_9CHLO
MLAIVAVAPVLLPGKVLRLSGAEQLDVVAHCMGATTFLMSLLAGHLRGQVRSAVLFNGGVHFSTVTSRLLKARLRVPSILPYLGINSMEVSGGFSFSWLNRLLDFGCAVNNALFGEVQLRETCTSGVCHRMGFIYGGGWEHRNISAAAHDNLHEIWGSAHMACLRQVTSCLLAGQLVDSKGQGVYMQHPQRLSLPITFITGRNNKVLVPASQQKTYQWLCDANGADGYASYILDGYSHNDIVIGRSVWRDVVPLLLRHLAAQKAPLPIKHA